MFTICRMITSATLRCIFVLCIQNHLLCFGLPSYNRHMSCATKSFIEMMRGLETSAGCLSNDVPCGWSSSQLGSCLSSSFSSHLSPSCGTCGSRRSSICCGMVMVGKQEGHLSPGNQQREPCHPFWGGLGRASTAAIVSTTAGHAIRDSGRLPGGKPEAHFLVVVQG